MRILLVSHYYGSHHGGIELVAEKLFHGLSQRQCEVVWAAANVTTPPSDVGSGSVLPLKSLNGVEALTGLPIPVPTIGGLRKLWSQVRRADVVLLHDCLYLSNIAALLYARIAGIPVVVVQHTRVAPYRYLLLRAFVRLTNTLITRWMLASAQQVVFISQNTARYFASVHYRRPPTVVFNGVDMRTFRPLENTETREAIREHFGLPRNNIVVLFVGRFVSTKGIPVMKRLTEMRPEWTWVFAGWGPLDPGSWNMPNVRVFSNLRGESLATLYRASDLLVLPSTGEGFPLVIQEALASGLPVVCGGDTPSADEAMRDFVRGVPVSVGEDDRTAREFLEAIDESLLSEAEKSKSAERRAFAVSRYSWDVAADRYFEITSSLVPSAASNAVESEHVAGEGH